MNAIGIYIVALIIIIFALLVIILLIKSKLNETEKRLESEREYAQGAMKELAKLQQEMKIKKEEKNVTENKIESLHNGDTVTNAINSLSKHKGC